MNVIAPVLVIYHYNINGLHLFWDTLYNHFYKRTYIFFCGLPFDRDARVNIIFISADF